MRFYDVDSGAVYVNGRDVRSVDPAELRKNFGVAFQNDFLMASAVRQNIDYGRGLADEAVQKAADCAQAGQFISSLRGGMNYAVAQKAANLSGGQKQRLTVARALAGDPAILVLDDSSSALDYATDAAMRRDISLGYPSATKIIVAQRVSSVKSADLILVLDDGRQIGLGTHEQLLKECGEYAMIYRAQMGEDI